MPKSNDEILISVDIEADGPLVGVHSMLSLGAVNVADPSQSFYAELKPIADEQGELFKRMMTHR
jgi:hypothetical protein